MQQARIRTRWKRAGEQVPIGQFANAVSAVCWRIALNAAKNLHEQDFVYADDAQRLAVIREYLFFLIHCSDRLMHDRLSADERTDFVTGLALNCLSHYRENARELLGREMAADETVRELDRITGRLSRCRFPEQRPGFEMLRLLGARIQDILGRSQTNKWVIDQVMEIDGLDAFEIFDKALKQLTRSSGYAAARPAGT